MGNDIHRLKLVQPYFDEVATGWTTIDVPTNGQDYKVGDVLLLWECDPNKQPDITSKNIQVRVIHVFDDPRYVVPSMIITAI